MKKSVILLYISCLLFSLNAQAASPWLALQLAAYAPACIQRDAFGDFSNIQTSEHFAAKWGPDHVLDPDLIDRTLVGLETAWSREINDMGWPAPVDSNDYCVNVYFASTGGLTFEVPEWLCFSSIDADGYAYIGMHWNVVENYGIATYVEFNDSTMAHEFNHIVQVAAEAFYANPMSRWMLEATATWMQNYLYPEGPMAAAAVADFFLTPELPLSFYPRNRQTSTPTDWRDYAASLFLVYLTEHFGPESVRDIGTRAHSQNTNDAMAIVDAILVKLGTSLASEYSSFAAHNSVFDYAMGAQYRQATQSAAMDYAQSDVHDITANISVNGTSGWVQAPQETLPGGMAYNVLRLNTPDAGTCRFEVKADEVGTENNIARFAAQLALMSGDKSVQYLPLPFTGNQGMLDVTLTDETAVYLAVVSVPQVWTNEERFSYSYKVTCPYQAPAEVSADNSNDEGGGCSTMPATGGHGFALLGLLLLMTTQRRCGHCT